MLPLTRDILPLSLMSIFASIRFRFTICFIETGALADRPWSYTCTVILFFQIHSDVTAAFFNMLSFYLFFWKFGCVIFMQVLDVCWIAVFEDTCCFLFNKRVHRVLSVFAWRGDFKVISWWSSWKLCMCHYILFSLIWKRYRLRPAVQFFKNNWT